MTAPEFIARFNRIVEARDAVPALRRCIWELAVRGKLADQDPEARPCPELSERIAREAVTQANLPLGWARASVGAVLTFQYGEGLDASKRTLHGPVPVFGSNGVVGFTSEFLTETPVIIVGRKGSAGALNLCEGPSWTTDVAYYVEAPSYFDIRFLLIALRTLDLDALSKGVKPGLSRSDAHKRVLCIPPVEEQRRIVAKVDALMKLCDELEAAQSQRRFVRRRFVAASLDRLNNRSNEPSVCREHVQFHLRHFATLTSSQEDVQRLRETILDLAVLGRLIEHDPQDEPASEAMRRIREKKAQLLAQGAIPRESSKRRKNQEQRSIGPIHWEQVRLSEVCNQVTSGSRGWAAYYAASGPKFIRAQNIRFGRLRLDDIAHVNPPQNSEGARTQVSRGDLFIVITGAGVTNPAMLDTDIGEAYVSQHVALLKLTDTSISPWLLLWLMAPAGGRGALVERAYGAGKPGLNLENIRTLDVGIPPFPEQQRILTMVTGLMMLCDELESRLAAALEHGHQFATAAMQAVIPSSDDDAFGRVERQFVGRSVV